MKMLYAIFDAKKYGMISFDTLALDLGLLRGQQHAGYIYTFAPPRPCSVLNPMVITEPLHLGIRIALYNAIGILQTKIALFEQVSIFYDVHVSLYSRGAIPTIVSFFVFELCYVRPYCLSFLCSSLDKEPFQG